MLFLSGTRDDLAEIGAMRELCAELGSRATLHEVDGGNHSFELRKSAGRSSAEVHAELASALADWIRSRA
jgi:predicted alpha/beta-hydrolase family hydrolase